MSKTKFHKCDPRIKFKHALQFFNNKPVLLAKALKLWPSQIYMWRSDPEALIAPLHAYRLKEKHPDIMLAVADFEAFELAENERSNGGRPDGVDL